MPIQLLSAFVAIPSVNPAFPPLPNGLCDAETKPASGVPNLLGERALAEAVADRARSVGLSVGFQEVLPRRSNVLVRLSPARRVRRRILLAPHLDTVGAPGDLEEMFRPVLRNGRLYGRGACDTKGSVAAMLAALLRLARSGRRPGETEITFAGLVDEENAQAGSRALAASGMRADLAIVGEPTRLQVVTAHKGDVWLRLETRGKSAHGARPELGRNAVHEMARIVEVLETTYAAQLRRRVHPLLGRATVNVGSIAGGTQPNIVPSQCAITVDRRTLPGESEAHVRAEILDNLRRHGLKATLGSARQAPCLPLDTNAQLPLVAQLLQAAGQDKAVGVDFFCDAAVLAQGGMASVVFGPGDIAQAHTASEFISVRSLEGATDLLERFLRSMP
jgi:acetylornithine deacetylase/succinyl-diaminopimelate desuccinylase-like protein